MAADVPTWPSISGFLSNFTFDANENGSAQQSFALFEFERIYIGSLIVFGIVGNLFSVLVFYFTRLRHSPTSVYLAALALCDTLFLAALMLVWLSMLNLSEIYVTNGVCQFVVYVINVTACLSTWLVVTFTGERYLVVVHPFHRLATPSIYRAKCAVLCLLPAPLLLYIISFSITGIQNDDDQFKYTNNCDILHQYRQIATIFHCVDVFVVLILPLLVIVSLNVRIGKELISAWRTKGTLEARQQLTTARANRELACLRSNGSKLSTQHRYSIHREFKITRMLAIVSSVYVLLNMPHNVVRLCHMLSVSFNSTSASSLDAYDYYVVLSLTDCLYYTNFAINSLLYNITSSKYRSCALELLVSCLRRSSTSPLTLTALRRGTLDDFSTFNSLPHIVARRASMPGGLASPILSSNSTSAVQLRRLTVDYFNGPSVIREESGAC